MRQLAHALTDKWDLGCQTRHLVENLEDLVKVRTVELEQANDRLKAEMEERARAELRLQQAQKLEAFGRLLAVMGHEINNPLTYLTLNLNELEEEITDLPPVVEEQQVEGMLELTRDAITGAERIREVVSQVRTYGKVQPVELQPVDVTAVLEGALRMADNQVRHHAGVVRNYADAPPVDADPNQLGQVFLNLLVNATQSMPTGRVSQNTLTVGVGTDDQGRAVVTISDTGCGIAPDDIKRIFDPYFTTKDLGEGTGLGLYVCLQIVMGLEGEIDAESEEGVGSTFRVVLPASTSAVDAPPQSAEPPARESASSNQRGRILVVDDDPSVRRAMLRVLRNHDVTTACDGREALELIAAESWDVVLCDLMMPDVDGIEVFAVVADKWPDVARAHGVHDRRRIHARSRGLPQERAQPGGGEAHAGGQGAQHHRRAARRADGGDMRPRPMYVHMTATAFALFLSTAAAGDIADTDAADTSADEASGGNGPDQIEDFSLTDLLDLETGVASWRPVRARESPGILTVVTRDENRPVRCTRPHRCASPGGPDSTSVWTPGAV